MIGPASIFIAIAVILSAIVSIIGTGARRQAVEDGRARAADLCELTGIFEPRALQDIFGPPTMNGIYQTDLKRVRDVRQPLSYLISEDKLDMACIAIAALSFFVRQPLLDLFLMVAAAYQTAGWFVSIGLPEKQKR